MPNYASGQEGGFKITHFSTSSTYQLEKWIDEDEMHNPIDNPHWGTVSWFEYGELEKLHALLESLKLK